MARFQFNKRSDAQASTSVGERSPSSVSFATATRPPPSGPGWFESSWDLSRGLDVHEGLPPNASLNEWLMACLNEGA